jgi:hypothetical protein
MRKYLAEIIIVVIVLLAVAVIIARSLSIKEASAVIDDGDLRVRPVRAAIAPEDNAFTYFARATNVMYYPKEFSSLYYGVSTNQDVMWATNGARLVQIIASNEAAFMEVEKGLACAKCQSPEATNRGSRVWSFVAFRNLSQLLCLKADWLGRNARPDEALDFAMRTIGIGQAIQCDAQGTLDFVIGLAIKNLGVRQVEILLDSCTIPSSGLKRLARELLSGRCKASEESLKNLIRADYRLHADEIDNLATGKSQFKDYTGSGEHFHLPFTGYALNARKTKSMLADQARQAIRRSAMTYSQMRIKKEESTWPSFELMTILRPNGWGIYLAGANDYTYAQTLNQHCQGELNRRAMGLLAALKAFKQDHSRLPQSLAELVPEYIDSIPADPFDGKPIRYSVEKKIIYSVGKDLMDSGGSEKTEERWQSSDPILLRRYAEDIVYRIEF